MYDITDSHFAIFIANIHLTDIFAGAPFGQKMISPKQKKILAFPYSKYDSIICDGAVRSGKTSIMTVSFVRWAMESFNGQRFGICGKTVDSTTKNIIIPFISMTHSKQRYTLKWRRSDKLLEVRRGRSVNYFEVFGGKDEASFMLIQGRTLAGVLMDEVVLMPESFVNQALARCSVDGARMWFSCNPGPPQHWFKTEWIDDLERHNALYLHFDMRDNPSLSEKTLERYERMYSGVFYQRYVLGLWVAAEGLVYPMFDEKRHVLTVESETEGDYYVSSDFGIQNATVFLLWRRERGSKRWICLREYYYSGRDERHQATVSELVSGLNWMLDGIKPKRIIIDPSAAALKSELRTNGYHMLDAENDVLNGISDVCTMLNENLIAFMACCKNTIREFGEYLWDSKAADAGIDAVIKENDHCQDCIRYLVRTLHLVQRKDQKPYTPIIMR